MPRVSTKIHKFLNELTLSTEEKAALREDIGAEESGSAAAAAAASQPLDADLTAYATAADAAARRVLIGAGTSNMPDPLALTEVPTSQVVTSQGTRQVFRISASNLATSPGNFTLTVQAAGLVGSPISMTVAAINGSFIYTPGEDALAGNSEIMRLFEIDPTNNNIGLRARFVNGLAPANDPTALITVTPGTATGIISQTSSITTTGVAGVGINPNPVPTRIGQAAIITHSDDTQTEWGAVSLVDWLPRTAGIIKKSDGLWYRQTIAADNTTEYNLLPDQ